MFIIKFQLNILYIFKINIFLNQYKYDFLKKKIEYFKIFDFLTID